MLCDLLLKKTDHSTKLMGIIKFSGARTTICGNFMVVFNFYSA